MASRAERDGEGGCLSTIRVRFYAELNDFLPPDRRQRELTLPLDRRTSVKDLVESLGVPHTEVDLIVADGEPVGFSHIVREGESIAVYPRFTAIDVAPLPSLREPEPAPRFVLDAHLGKLAAYLRLLGFDALYSNGYDDAELARIAAAEGRILLTRDLGLLKRRTVAHGCYVRETDPERQVAEVLRRYDLAGSVQPFRRCMRCNGRTEPVPKEEIEDRLEPLTRRYYDEFRICAECGRIYWKGSHFGRMQALVERLLRPGALRDREDAS